MKKFEGNSIRNVITDTGKIPYGVGFPSGSQTGGGVIRKLTRKELSDQAKLSQPSR